MKAINSCNKLPPVIMIVTIKREHLFDNTRERDRRREKKEYVPLYYITPPPSLSVALALSNAKLCGVWSVKSWLQINPAFSQRSKHKSPHNTPLPSLYLLLLI